MSKQNNTFSVFSSITDDNGKKWDIAHSGVYGHFVLMKPEDKPNFKKMTKAQLIEYIKDDKQQEEA
jgi:uncharacterized protein affecting Mg2+/Co2+ transport